MDGFNMTANGNSAPDGKSKAASAAKKTRYDIPLGKSQNDPVNLLLSRVATGSRVLEFGCANGRATRAMKEKLGCQVYVVEIDEEAIRDAVPYAEKALCGNIMDYQWKEEFAGISFDYIMFADVLEHLPEPADVLKHCGGLLKKGGSILVSVPNIAHNDIISRLWNDEFHYTVTGILDNTHVHFWAYQELDPFFDGCGYTVVWDDAVIKDTNDTEQRTVAERLPAGVENRPMGTVYEFALQIMRREDAAERGILPQRHIEKRAKTITRQIYFDCGDGFDFNAPHVLYASLNDAAMDFELPVPAHARLLRVDPVENRAALFENIVAEGDTSVSCEIWPGNGIRTEYGDVFLTSDPQYFIRIPERHPGRIRIRASRVSYDLKEIAGVLYRRSLEEVPGDVFIEKSLTENRSIASAFELEWSRLEAQDSERRLRDSQKQNDVLSGSVQALTASIRERDCRQEELDTEIRRLSAELAQSVERRGKLEQECQRARMEAESKARERDELERRLRETAGERDETERRLRETEGERDRYREAYGSVSNAFFWKLTKPLRLLTDWLKRFLAWLIFLPFIKGAAKGLAGVFQKLFPRFYDRFLLKIKNKLKGERQEVMRESARQAATGDAGALWRGEKPRPFEKPPLVSVVVPNYNHAPYLRQRLESVYGQSYPNFEVILLDDCSTDDSREILTEYAERYPDKTVVDFNKTNSGRVFKQWNKGIGHARGSLIWIAESDDWCDPDFLEKLVPRFEYESVMLAFARSVFMQDGAQIWTLEEYLADLPELDFSTPFMMSSHMAVNRGFAVKNIVPNVSSAVFRNTGEIPEEITDIWQNIKLCGDWLFYLHTIRGGTISYTNETTNYYRVHQNSTSLKIQQSDEYYKEQEQISRYVASHYKVELSVFEKVRHILEEHCRAIRATGDVSPVHENYSLDAIAEAAKARQPNVLMCGFSMQMGGGETYPIYLANEMERQGLCVTFLNFDLQGYSDQVRRMLSPTVPLVTLKSPDNLGSALIRTGAEVIHSHHASVDNMISVWLENSEIHSKQIVSMHGMYEGMDEENRRNTLGQLKKTCSCVVYTAEKNLQAIDALGLRDDFKLVKIGNALPEKPINPVDRSSMGIGTGDFVLTLVSRALPEKGWKEAAEAVVLANRKSSRTIRLILIGDGPMKRRLEKRNLENVYLLGEKSNIRDYFAMSDMGFLPSAFRGESFPLVVVDCLLSDRPVLASNVGETANQLMDEDGNYAGELFDLHDWTIDVEALADQIARIANDKKGYQEMRKRVASAKQKFDLSKVVQKYRAVYEASLRGEENDP